MESVVVVKQVDEFVPIKGADRVEVAKVGLLTVVTQKGRLPGRYVHILPDAFASREVWDKLGAYQYTQHRTLDGKEHGRVRAAKIRGVSSWGFIVEAEEFEKLFGLEAGSLQVGMHIPESPQVPITKYEVEVHQPRTGPSRYFSDYRMEREVSDFPKFAKFQNFYNVPDLFESGEHVIVTEKIHGTNHRIGLVRDDHLNFKVMIGSHEKRRAFAVDSIYELPLRKFPKIVDLLRECPGNGVVLYGEIYGGGTQKGYDYGVQTPEYRAFALRAKYLGEDVYLPRRLAAPICEAHGVPMAPVLYEGPFDLEVIRKLANGQTTINGATHIREGVFVESEDGQRRMKIVSEDYIIGVTSGEAEESVGH